MKFFHVADLHLGAQPDKGKPWSMTRKQEIYESFERLIKQANEEQIDFLFLCGDVFHKPPVLREVREFDYLLTRLQGTRTIFIAGNHDYMSEDSPLRDYEFRSNTVFLGERDLECAAFEEEGVYVYGFSYWQQEITTPRYADVHPEAEEGIHILLAHGGDSLHIPIDFEKLKWSGFDYIALGHIHKPEILSEDLMAYAGSLEPIDPTETGAHGYISGEITDEKQVITFVPFAQRSYLECELYLHDEMSEMEIYDLLETELLRMGPENYFHVILNGNLHYGIQLDFSRLEEDYQIISFEDNLTQFGDYDAMLEENRDNLIGKVMVRLKEEPEALTYAMKALLSSAE